MKHVTLFLLLITSLSYSQDYYDDDGNFHFKNIIDVEGKTQNQLYASSKKWLAVNFTDLNRVLKLDSQENIIVKGNFELQDTGGTRVDFTMDIAFKDGKLKTEFYDVIVRPKAFIPEYPLTNQVVFTKEDYINLMKKEFAKSGLTEKQSKKAIDQMGIDELLSNIIKGMESYSLAIENRINELSSDLESYVKKEGDGW